MPHRQLQNHVLRTMFGHGRWQRRSCNKGMPPLHNHRRLLRTLLPVRPEPTDIQKLRVEISRLEILVKKLQTELQIERQYNQALELHVRTLTQVD